jgi:hypothetical protein
MGRVIHGHTRHPLYQTWRSMIQRCTNPEAPYWAQYGGRGIDVCEEWLESFEAFVEDVGERPQWHTLDRIDNDGDYELGNVRWASRSQQYWNSSADLLLHPERSEDERLARKERADKPPEEFERERMSEEMEALIKFLQDAAPARPTADDRTRPASRRRARRSARPK